MNHVAHRNTPDPLSHITPRERQLLTLLATGAGQPAAARMMDCSIQTVHTVLAHLYTRWGVNRLESAIVHAIVTGVLSMDQLREADAVARGREGGE